MKYLFQFHLNPNSILEFRIWRGRFWDLMKILATTLWFDILDWRSAVYTSGCRGNWRVNLSGPLFQNVIADSLFIVGGGRLSSVESLGEDAKRGSGSEQRHFGYADTRWTSADTRRTSVGDRLTCMWKSKLAVFVDTDLRWDGNIARLFDQTHVMEWL